jgi:hypothetical protein
MADIVQLRKVDAECEQRKTAALEVLQRVMDSVRENRADGMLVIAFEKPCGGPEVEMCIHRYYLSGGIGDMLTLLGISRCVTDEMSEGSRYTVGLE